MPCPAAAFEEHRNPESTEALGDEELMTQLCASGDETEANEVFDEIFRRYQPRVSSWCYRFVRNRSTALDLTQEVFFKAYRYKHCFRGDSSLSTWLFAITRNHCLSAIRKRASDPVELGETMPPRLRDSSVIEPEREIERERLSGRLRQMLEATLEPLEARVMTLHYGYEMPLAVITTRLGLSNPSGAKAYVVNARRKLSKYIQRRRLDDSCTAAPAHAGVACKTAA
jgi:RNA polymerase sigma factor (sigma-70 family)